MSDAELHRVLVDIQPTTQKLDIADPQRDRFAPTQTAVRQHQHHTLGRVPCPDSSASRNTSSADRYTRRLAVLRGRPRLFAVAADSATSVLLELGNNNA